MSAFGGNALAQSAAGGGDKALGALQAGAVATGLSFTLVLMVMCVGLVKSLREEHRALVLAGAT